VAGWRDGGREGGGLISETVGNGMEVILKIQETPYKVNAIMRRQCNGS